VATPINIKYHFGKWLLALSFLLLAFSSYSQTYVTSPMTTTPAAGEYYNNSSILLSPGFSFMATSGSSLHLYIQADCVPLGTVPSVSQNYIITSTPRIQGITNAAGLLNRNACELMQTVQYLDGLGRPIQTVMVKGNPDATKDMIQPTAYDAFGRETSKYLPYTTATGSPGSYRSDALNGTSGYSNSGQKVFYNQTGQNYTTIPSPLAVTGLEPSPLNRVVEQGAPGDPWQFTGSGDPNSAFHTVKTAYLVNNATAITDTANTRIVALYTVTINSDQSRTLVRTGNNATYDAGQLYVTLHKDENWKTGRGGTMEEYKDKEGHVLLKRTFNYIPGSPATFQMLSTYYVYDDLGNLAFVLPPGANPDNNAAITQATLDNLCYQYCYDERNRNTQKKLPGKGWDYTVYNQLDQPVLTQDARQRTGNQWTVAKYDKLGRTILTGLWNAGSVIPLATLQASIYGVAQWDARDYTNNGTSYPTGYVIRSYPQTLTNYLSINYYDDYGITNLPATYDVHTNIAYSNVTAGLPTGNKIAVLNPDGTVNSNMLWSVNYYDDKGRSIKSYKQHYLGGQTNYSTNNYDEVSTVYNFTNVPTQTVGKHHTAAATGGVTLTVANNYDYDHLGRKINSWEQINTGSNILLSKAVYNEVGQPYIKHLHSADNGTSFLQDVTYSYNERGWLSKSSALLFEELLQYNSVTNIPGITPAAQYNGNIASQSYGNSTTPNTTSFTYSYDLLNRLTNGTSTKLYSENNIAYDVMGNTTRLQRTWNDSNVSTTIDNLTYFYTDTSGNNTNQLQKITDASTDNRGVKSGANQPYTYDVNGNMITDNSKGLGITYNLLNLPAVNTLTGGTISYTYDAAGTQLRKVSTIGAGSTTEYIGGIQYSGPAIDFVRTEEGRILNITGTPNYEYSLTDHLGNSRVAFDSNTGGTTTKQTDDYMPFGMEILSGVVPLSKNEYLYNKKELQEELGVYDYGARFYDPVIARWTSIDPLAEASRRWNPYNYVENDPIRMTDPDGMSTTNDGSSSDIYREIYFPSRFRNLGYPDDDPKKKKKRQQQSSDQSYLSSLWSGISNYNFSLNVTEQWDQWLDHPESLFTDAASGIWGLSKQTFPIALLYEDDYVKSISIYQNASSAGKGAIDASRFNSFITSIGTAAPFAEFGGIKIPTTADGFLGGSIGVKLPFDLKVGLYASENTLKYGKFKFGTLAPDFLGGTNWFGRNMLQITPEFQPNLGVWSSNQVIRAGTSMRIGFVGPQPGMGMGSWLQIHVPNGVPYHK
jgi:RHS repeat-associated protein